MTRLRTVKTSFTAGEIAPTLLGRTDLRAFENGARRLSNVFIHPTGGLSRRAGLAFVDPARGPGRLVAFAFNVEQTYLLVFTDRTLDIYRSEVRLATLDTPWNGDQLERIAWTQSADTLLVCHPDVPPRRITRTGDADWQIRPWEYVSDDGALRLPLHRFAAPGVTLAPSAVTGNITVTASAPVFTSDHEGTRLDIGGKQVEVTGVISPTQAAAIVRQELLATTPTTAWSEQAFSAVRGWPATAIFHQDRLVIGGSRDLPNQLWLSRSADIWNFDLGDGEDDAAIAFGILSDDVNAIRALFSGRHLQVFTSGAEWNATGDPLTPKTIQLTRQTRVGSPGDRHVPPRGVDGATLFVGRTGTDLREFVFTDVEQAYLAPDLALLAPHLVRTPVDMDFDPRRRLLFVVMADGTLAALTIYRTEQVTAWTRVETDGRALAVAAVGDAVYLLVERTGGIFIEVLDDGFGADSAVRGVSETPRDVWAGLDHLEGQLVMVRADGVPRPLTTVASGRIIVDPPATAVDAGLPFSHVVEPLPPGVQGAGSEGLTVRLVEVGFRLLDTCALRADAGGGLQDVPLARQVLSEAPPPPFSGDARVRALGWRRDALAPLWRIAQDIPLPFTLLSVTSWLKVND